MSIETRHSHLRRALLAACAGWFCFILGDTSSARVQPLRLGAGETANDAVRRGILAGKQVPRNTRALRARLQGELGGTLRTHIVSNGGDGHAAPTGTAFMCFETYEGPIVDGKVEQWELMIGFFLDRDGNALSPGESFVELIAWDRTKKVFNFWELIDSEWFYRGDSNDIAANVAGLNLGDPNAGAIFKKASADQSKVLRCSGCHSQGAPVMKEIEPPFNDWWRTARPLDLLELDLDSRAKALFAGATDASNLSEQVKRGIDRLAADRAIKGLTLQQRMRSLVTAFEMNLASDTLPFKARTLKETAVEIPAAFFVDSRLLDKASPVRVERPAYGAALDRVDSRFPPRSQTPAGQKPNRESQHAFVVPVRSAADNRIVDDLTAQGLLDAELVADVLAVDPTTPVFSPERASLIRFFPASAKSADDLRTQLVAALNKAPSGHKAAQALLANLTDPARTAETHRRAAAAFLETCQKAAATPAAIEGWLRHAHGQRRAIDEAQTAQHAQGSITERGFRNVFPAQSQAPERLRLNPATCLAEPRPVT